MIADKTADFVAKNGPEFESRIMATNQDNAKFRFLNTSDPFRAYYDMKVRTIRAALAEEKAKAAQPEPTPTPAGDEEASAGDHDMGEPTPAPEDTKPAEVRRAALLPLVTVTTGCSRCASASVTLGAAACSWVVLRR